VIAVLVNEIQSERKYEPVLNAEGLPLRVYFNELKTSGFLEFKTSIL